MLRACQHLPDLDVLTALEPLLRSPVRWVRDQALILLGAAPGDGAPRRDNLGSEMAVQLATQQLLPRWRSFIRALAAARSRRLWACFAVATFFALLDLALPLGATFHFLHGIQTDPELMRSTPQLRSWRGMAFLLPGLAALFALRSDRPAWRWIVLSAPVGLCAIFAGLELWQGAWVAFIGGLIGCVLIVLVGVPVVALVSAAFRLGILLLYAVATRRLRGPGPSVRSLAGLAWEEGGYATLRAYGHGLTAPFTLVIGGFFIAVTALVWLWKKLGIPSIEHAMNWFFAISCALGLGAMVFEWLQTRFRESVKAGLVSAAKLAITGGVALGLYGAFTSWNRKVAQVLALVLALSLLASLGWQLLQAARRGLASRRHFRPQTFSAETWIKALRDADPQEQEILLVRTTHRSLGLSPEEFLDVLVTAEPQVKRDPALSAYSERRDQVEQALRQERGG